MGARCGNVTYCRLRVQLSSPGCGLLEQPLMVGSREARLALINGWQVRD